MRVSVVSVDKWINVGMCDGFFRRLSGNQTKQAALEEAELSPCPFSCVPQHTDTDRNIFISNNALRSLKYCT